jgi:hypothetical protein
MKIRSQILAFSGAAAIILSALSSKADLVFDNISNYQGGNTNAGISSTSSTPNTFMGGGYTLLPGTTSITGFDLYPVNLSGTAYTGLKLNIFVWGNVNTSGTVNSTTPAFGNLLGTYTSILTGSYNTGFYFPLQGSPVGTAPGITLGSPIALTGTTIGLTFNFQGTTDGLTYNNANSLTSLISYGMLPSVGSQVFNGYYRNAAGETDGNFVSSLRSLGLQNQSLAVRVYGNVVPEPSSLALLSLGTAALVAFRRRQ